MRYLAVDIGASSGRHILMWLEDGKIQIKEAYRFENRPVLRDGRLCWDVEALFDHIVEGLVRLGEENMAPASMAIDTWGVDYVLVDGDGDRLGEAYAYRDGRTEGPIGAVESIVSTQALYRRTGIQKQPFNTIYQLMSDKEIRPRALDSARRMLMMPEYLTYRLTGEMHSEYTISSTSAMLSAAAGDWDRELIAMLGLPEVIFGALEKPGAEAGILRDVIAEKVGFQTKVRLAPAHDTASAVLAAPIDDSSIFLSSGTWSLMGLERKSPDLSVESEGYSLSNEGGYGGTFRLLKNIMGLWMIQSLRREDAPGIPFPTLAALAMENDHFPGRVDVNDRSFLAPVSMGQAIDSYLAKTGQQVPESLGQRLACVYHSLAESYRETAGELASLTGRDYGRICLVGGGSQDDYLNSLTAKVCGKIVTAGPVEATALGNGLSQMLADGVFASVEEGREAIARSFPVKLFHP